MLGKLPRIVGVLNITEDSFSDGGLYLERARAMEHAADLVNGGCDVLEVGAAASNPDAGRVSPEEEIRRLEPILEKYVGRIPLSVDSFQAETQLWAIERGVDFLNDIRGFPRPEVHREIANARCKLVVVHSIQSGWKAERVRTDPSGLLDRVETFLRDRVDSLIASGVARDRVIVDPGMGYFLGTNPEASIEVLCNLSDLRERLRLPVMVSVSRKSFLRTLTGREVASIGPATLAAEIYAANRGADYIRTHDVRALRDALKVLTALTQARGQDSNGREHA
jgi:dihydropteroate synthase type 2